MKLIDADRLKAEIERLKSKYRHNGLWLSSTQSMLAGAKIEAMNELLLSLDSLQQEQQEEPDKGLDVTDFCKPIDPGIAQCVADHWHEMLGEEEPDKSLEEAAQQYAEGPECTWVGTTALEEAFKAGAQWDAKHLRDTTKMIKPEKCENIPNDLEEAAEEYTQQMLESWRFDSTGCRPPRESFIAGAKWQKGQMMDEWLKDRDGCFWDGVNEGKKAMEEQMLRIAKNRYEQAMTFVTGNPEVDQAIQMDRLALVKIIEEGGK